MKLFQILNFLFRFFDIKLIPALYTVINEPPHGADCGLWFKIVHHEMHTISSLAYTLHFDIYPSIPFYLYFLWRKFSY